MKSLKIFFFIFLVVVLAFNVCLGFSVNEGGGKGSAVTLTPGGRASRAPYVPGQRPAAVEQQANPSGRADRDVINPLQVKSSPLPEDSPTPVLPSQREKPKNNLPLFIGIAGMVIIAAGAWVFISSQKQKEQEF